MVAADNGLHTIANQTVSEVGVFSVTATPPLYLGETIPVATSTSIGRFYPAYFETAVTNACTNYTYSGEPFDVTMTAYNNAGVVTTNYFGSFVKNPTVKDKSDTYTLTNNVFDGVNHFTATAAGSATNSTVTLTFASKETAPATVTIEANSENGTPSPATSDDISSDGYTEGSVLIRSGRLLMNNTYGSELSTLTLPVTAQYYDGTNYITNVDDGCSIINLANLTLTTAVETLDGTNLVRIKAGSAKTTSASIAYSPLAAGELGLSFSPTCTTACTDGDGSVLTTIDLGATGANLPWLQYDWDGDGTHDNNPSGTASFGLYRGDDRIIFQREMLP
jgi:MSHA biogenesis protein MshQ